MAFISAGDFRKGITFQLDAYQVMQIVEFMHVKPGKGAAFVRAKIKNVMTGAVLERTFNPTEKYEMARIEKKAMEYSYNDGELYYFMDVETYDTLPLNKNICEDALQFISENMEVTIAFFNGTPYSVEPPNFVELAISFCEPGIKGNTTQSATKPATLETGYVIQVPMFINEGEVIRVDTRTGSYMSRA